VYKAALLCKNCGEQTRQQLAIQGLSPVDLTNEHSYDSDDFPKGPYVEGGGESDTPQHCDQCGKFLANPLTSDGEQYVLNEMLDDDGGLPIEYEDAYGYLIQR
jgi:hypothetical protein